jgi:hypothetical protein
MKAFLAILLLLTLCLAFAPASGAMDKADEINAAMGNATSGAEAAAPEAIAPAADESHEAEEVAPKAKKAAKPTLEKPEGFHVRVHDGRLRPEIRRRYLFNRQLGRLRRRPQQRRLRHEAFDAIQRNRASEGHFKADIPYRPEELFYPLQARRLDKDARGLRRPGKRPALAHRSASRYNKAHRKNSTKEKAANDSATISSDGCRAGQESQKADINPATKRRN